jgi:hypothetical protein
MKKTKKKAAKFTKSQKWVAAVLSLSRSIGELKDSEDPRNRLFDELPFDDHRPLFYFGQQTMQLELICDTHHGLCFTDLNDFRSDAALVVQVDFGDKGRVACHGWIERDRFLEKATNIDGDYCCTVDDLNDPGAKDPTGSASEISRIRYKDGWQYSLEVGGWYVLGGYRIEAYPGHIDRNLATMDFAPWFLQGMDIRVLHMIRQDGHIYIIRTDEPIPDLSKLKPTRFRISDMIPIDDALQQCAENGHTASPFGCAVCGDPGELRAEPHVRDFGFGPVWVELNLPQNPKQNRAHFHGIEPPILPNRVVVQSDRLTSGNVRVVTMVGTRGSAPSLAGGFRLVVDYEKPPTEQDLLEHRLMAGPYQRKALAILRGLVPPDGSPTTTVN